MKKIYSIFVLLICILTVNAQVDRSIRPSSAPAKEIDIKNAKVFTLSNGLKVFLVEDKTTPLTYYNIVLDVKPTLEKEKAGMSEMFNDVFGQATKTRSKEQLNKEIDLIGAQMQANKNGGYIFYLKKYETKALELLSDAILNPNFSQEEFELTLGKYQTALSSLGDDAGQINQRVSSALTYGKNYPDGEVETMETLANIHLSDLEEYYNTYFAPNVARLVIVGNVSEKEAKASAEKYFGKWKKKNVPEAKYAIPSALEAPKVAYIVKPGAVQTSIDISYPINYKIGVPEYEACQLMNHILGGSGTGRLFLNLRETHSYTYGVYTDIRGGELVGRFNIQAGRGSAASVKAAATDSAIYQLFHEFNRIANEPVTEEELVAAKAYVAGSFSRSLENSGTVANFAINIDKYNLPKDYYKNYLKRLDAVTIADVQAAAKKHIRPNNAWIVATGDKSHADGLLPYASDNTIHYYDYNANPTEAPSSVEANITVEQLVNNYIKALGGKDAIDNINDYEILGSVNMMGQVLDMKQLFKKPQYSLTEISVTGMTVQQVIFDGTTIKMSGMAGTQELTDEDSIENAKNQTGICTELNYINNGYTLEVAGIEDVNGSNAYVLNISKGSRKLVSYFDVETGLKVKSAETIETPMGEQQSITEYIEYKEINGVMFPFKVKQSAGGMVMEMETTSVEVNKNIDDSVFK